jgi:methylglyoxal synthase
MGTIIHSGRASNVAIALIAHDSKKADLLEWASSHVDLLRRTTVFATDHTGALLVARLGLVVCTVRSGLQGGDLQLAAMIIDGGIDGLIFLWDPISSHPHDADVRALLRVADFYDLPTATNRRTAELLLPALLASPSE